MKAAGTLWGRRLGVSALVLAGVLVGAVTQAAALSPGHPARWIFHDFIVELDSMPQSYTCDQLWYKFRDTLRAIGARPTQILAYDCARANGARSLSPKVEVKFELPDRLQSSQARYADMNTSVQTVDIAPGTLPSLAAQDCVLVQRVTAELIQPLGIPIRKADFQCGNALSTYDLVLNPDKVVPKRRAAVNKAA